MGVGLTEGLALAEGLAEELALADADALTDAVAEALADDAAAAPGESFGSFAAGVDPEQAAVDADASKVAMAQPAAVSLTPYRFSAEPARILIGPPHKPAS